MENVHVKKIPMIDSNTSIEELKELGIIKDEQEEQKRQELTKRKKRIAAKELNDEIYEAYRNIEKAYASLETLLEDLFDCSYIREGLEDYMKLILDQNGVMAEITFDYLSKAEKQLRELDRTANF